MLKTCVIGVGNMGRHHARVYKSIDECKLVAVADISAEARDVALQYKCKYYSDYMEMLESEDVEAVSICTPTSLHKEVAIDCINLGKHVLIEKPISSTVEDGEGILNLARKKGIHLTVGHIERFNPAVQRLKMIMKEGLGDPISILARRVGIFPPQIKDANVIVDLAVHDIDVFNYLLEDPPTEVYAKSGVALNGGREDHAIIILSYEGTDCVVQVNWITPVKVRELSITGTKGYAELNYITQELRIFESSYERSYDSFGDFVLKFGTPKETPIEVERVEPLMAELSHFIACIEGREQPIITGEDGIFALNIAAKAIESYKKKRPVKLSET